MKKTKIVVVANQKGGVGKSTLAFHLAHAASSDTSRVLCVDLDSQGNLSQYLTGDLDIIRQTKGGVGLLFEGKPVVPMKTTNPQIDVLYGHSKLDRYDSDTEAEARAYSGEIGDVLRGLNYDYIIVDTPPAVGLRHLAALTWADSVVIPMEPVMSGIVGFQNVLASLNEYILPINPDLKWFVVANRANMRVRSHREKISWVQAEYGDHFIGTLTTRTAVSDAMEESPAQPVWLRRSAPKLLRVEWRTFGDLVIGG